MKKLLGKQVADARRDKIKSTVKVAVRMTLSITLSLVMLSCNSDVKSYNADVKFDSAKWKNGGGENILLDTRLNMAKDLIESQLTINQTELEIIELLGPPTQLHGNSSDSIKFFEVKEEYGSDIDPEALIFIKIEFNDEGKAISTELFSIR